MTNSWIPLWVGDQVGETHCMVANSDALLQWLAVLLSEGGAHLILQGGQLSFQGADLLRVVLDLARRNDHARTVLQAFSLQIESIFSGQACCCPTTATQERKSIPSTPHSIKAFLICDTCRSGAVTTDTFHILLGVCVDSSCDSPG